MSEVRIISAARSFEFEADSLSLVRLSAPDVRLALVQTFGFQFVAVAAPPAMFAVPQPSDPPGLVCRNGVCQLQQAVVPVRGLYFDSRRVVLDIEGESFLIDQVYERLAAMLSGLQPPTPLLDRIAVVRTLDMTELSSDLIAPERLVDSKALTTLSAMIGPHDAAGRPAFNIRATWADVGSAYVGDAPLVPFEMEIAPRVGRPVEERIVYSRARLSTESHLEILRRMSADC